ncbi:hypothetical protein F5887DRAFT_922539 [Amanita rubescens]|nr:hypothetical protein F5887DRAFT_922539 [Amanita rubescens]
MSGRDVTRDQKIHNVRRQSDNLWTLRPATVINVTLNPQIQGNHDDVGFPNQDKKQSKRVSPSDRETGTGTTHEFIPAHFKGSFTRVDVPITTLGSTAAYYDSRNGEASFMTGMTGNILRAHERRTFTRLFRTDMFRYYLHGTFHRPAVLNDSAKMPSRGGYEVKFEDMVSMRIDKVNGGSADESAITSAKFNQAQDNEPSSKSGAGYPALETPHV